MAGVIENTVDWHYMMRREMQQVYPRLYLGPYSAVNNMSELPKLVSAGITHIVCVRSEAESRIVKPHFPDQFQYLIVNISMTGPSTFEELCSIMEKSNSFIFSCMETGGTCLIHGISGMFRSTVVALGFIIYDSKCSEMQALKQVSERRYCVTVPKLQIQLLQKYAQMIDNQENYGPSSKRRKIANGYDS